MQGWGSFPGCCSGPLTGSSAGGCCGSHLLSQSAIGSEQTQTSAGMPATSEANAQMMFPGQSLSNQAMQLGGSVNESVAAQNGEMGRCCAAWPVPAISFPGFPTAAFPVLSAHG